MSIASPSAPFSGMDELTVLLNSRRRAILVNTFEEERFLEDLKAVLESKTYDGYDWSITSGTTDIISGKTEDDRMVDPLRLMKWINSLERQSVIVLKDFHDLWANYQAKRALRDFLERPETIYKPIILVSHERKIPAELEKLITIVDYELPTREQVIELLEGMEAYALTKNIQPPKGRERDSIIHALVGMTKSEIVNVLSKSIVKNLAISLSEIQAEKAQVIKKTGLLEYVTKLGDMDSVGGLDVIKDWFDDAQYAFDPEARKYNIAPVRGAIVTGFPGTGKSLTAKSVAHKFNLPLLKMNMSDIMDSKVGSSEKNIDRALRLADSVAPCVLWVDEIEKAFSGVASSDQSDAGTTSRVFQSWLTWLSDRTAQVFVIGTANSIKSLPPELTRAGRIDEVFFVSVPHQDEREAILNIHLSKAGYKVIPAGEVGIRDMLPSDMFTDQEVSQLAEEMEEFTGAEIEQVVVETGRRAYASWRKGKRQKHFMNYEDIKEQIHQTVPLSKREPELLKDLREWAKGAAKCASSEEHRIIHGGAPNKLFTLKSFSNELDI